MIIPGLGVSNTIRGAVAQWAKTLALELGQFRITVNNILPGYTATTRLQDLAESKAKAMGVPLEDFPNVAAWRGRIKERKAVQRAINLYKDQQNHGANKATAATNKILYNQSAEHLRTRNK